MKEKNGVLFYHNKNKTKSDFKKIGSNESFAMSIQKYSTREKLSGGSVASTHKRVGDIFQNTNRQTVNNMKIAKVQGYGRRL